MTPQREPARAKDAGLFEDLFIFEMANNHQGSVQHGLRIIESMAGIAERRGIRAGIKLQYRDLDTFIHPDYAARTDVKHIPRFLGARLSATDFLTLIGTVRRHGMIPICTPFDEMSVRSAVSHGIEILKIASCSAADWPLLEAVAETGRPVIASTAGLSLLEADRLVDFFAGRSAPFALMHCVALYPTLRNQLELNLIDKLRSRYPGLPIGYSGHEEPANLDAGGTAVSKGATVLERHVGVSSSAGPLNAYSMTPEQTEDWVKAVLRVKEICGNGAGRRPSEEETSSLASLKRGVFARRAISKGEAIGRDAVFFAMPCQSGQLTSGEFGRRPASCVASQSYAPNQPVYEQRITDTATRIEETDQTARAMLHEAHIQLGPDCQVELSHHYGLSEFLRVGAVIVNVINREYCKKLIVVLPGQRHPNHRHDRKEETFQLLWGDLEVILDRETAAMEPGDTLLIERGRWHQFSSRDGAVFEEVSTTHFLDDSFYEDPRISALDPMERKTLLENWQSAEAVIARTRGA